MRPSTLNPLFASLTELSGIGTKVAALFARLLGTDDQERQPQVVDLLFHLPSGVVDRRDRPSAAEAVPGAIATLKLTVDGHRPAPPDRRRAPHRVYCHDATGDIALVFFNANRNWIERTLPVGATRWVSGQVDEYAGQLQIVHPDFILEEAEFDKLPLVEPVYPRTEGLGARVIARAMAGALERIPELPEWQDKPWLDRQGWPRFSEALRTLHRPQTPEDAAPDSPAWCRLAYDELLAGQLALALVRRQFQHTSGIGRTGDGRRVSHILSTLPFPLTNSQHMACEEIAADLAAPERMLRLLQGDVGSGKTVVAVLAMATVAEAGAQSALMAPTELLARQHFRTIQPLAEAAGLVAALLTGREKGKERAAIRDAIADGEIHIVVGTHALFQSDIAFHDLGLVVIDEQHRFGVHQRLALSAKGAAPDILVMTATPIPRTLLLSHYGDMDSTRLTEKPAGRQPVETRTMSAERIDEVVAGIARAVRHGAQVYWVCPLVEDSETLDVTSAEARFAALKQVFGDAVGLIHGRLSPAEKDDTMRRFVEGSLSVLVATTVIEVGVDVPAATVMVIENAERFGLAQLHQLRGRVGRGSEASHCLLVYNPPLGETARARLAILRESEDGFRIAEEDLRLRGGGEILGTRQSGMPEFAIARVETHMNLVSIAQDDARLALERDPTLETERGQALRTLLYLFRRESAMRLIAAG